MKATEKERTKIQEYRRRYYQANREKLRWQQKENYNRIKNDAGWKEKEAKRRKQWWRANKALHRAVARASWQKLKEDVIAYYSKSKNRCSWCGFDDMRTLTIDHMDGGGSEHRRQINNFYSWLKRNNYPKGYQVLCMNCQFIKRAENKESRLIDKAIGGK